MRNLFAEDFFLPLSSTSLVIDPFVISLYTNIDYESQIKSPREAR